LKGSSKRERVELQRAKKRDGPGKKGEYTVGVDTVRTQGLWISKKEGRLLGIKNGRRETGIVYGRERKG